MIVSGFVFLVTIHSARGLWTFVFYFWIVLVFTYCVYFAPFNVRNIEVNFKKAVINVLKQRLKPKGGLSKINFKVAIQKKNKLCSEDGYENKKCNEKKYDIKFTIQMSNDDLKFMNNKSRK